MSDIARLFAEDPLKLTKSDIGELVAYYRERRAAFNLGDKTAGSTKKMKAESNGPKVTKLDLDDLLS